MSSTVFVRPTALILALTLAGCGQETPVDTTQNSDTVVTTREVAEPVTATPAPSAETEPSTQPIEHSLVPLPGVDAPVLTQKTTISLLTDAGEVLVEIYPEAAPNAVQRFIELVESGFYDNTPVSRVVPGFVAQFGINWREPYKAWEMNKFNDDPTFFALERGTLAFAKAGPNSNSTQVFINYVENNQLAAPQYNFTVFGKVVSGMEIVDAFVVAGDPGNGLDQGRLWTDGGAYLDELETKPTMITRAALVE
ncbi:MAG: hypothetical protein RLZZ227_2634 [Pseudomonadota bacterium]|jgi:cyclophilin family peptidyl-prolyl cis-trans isomerase